MSVYARFKRDPEGFRKLVELLETTPKDRREKMIKVGMLEDPDYTEEALKYMLTFEDILKLPDEELAEVVNNAPGRIIAFAINKLDKENQERFLRCCQPKLMAEVRDHLEVQIGLREIGGAQLKLVAAARERERLGFIHTKQIPVNISHGF